MFTDLVNLIPACERGDVRIEHVAYRGRTYVKLLIDGECWMSDAPDERELNRVIVERARGDVLICGLGLGMILTPILAKPEVHSVTVIERNPNVMELIGPLYSSPKLLILEADIWAWETVRRFDVIWQDVVFDPPNEMDVVWALGERLRILLKPDGWLGAWLGAWRCDGQELP